MEVEWEREADSVSTESRRDSNDCAKNSVPSLVRKAERNSPNENPRVIKKTETYLAHLLICPSAHLNDTPQISSFPYDLRQKLSPLGRSIPSPEWTPAFEVTRKE